MVFNCNALFCKIKIVKEQRQGIKVNIFYYIHYYILLYSPNFNLECLGLFVWSLSVLSVTVHQKIHIASKVTFTFTEHQDQCGGRQTRRVRIAWIALHKPLVISWAFTRSQMIQYNKQGWTTVAPEQYFTVYILTFKSLTAALHNHFLFCFALGAQDPCRLWSQNPAPLMIFSPTPETDSSSPE